VKVKGKVEKLLAPQRSFPADRIEEGAWLLAFDWRHFHLSAFSFRAQGAGAKIAANTFDYYI